MNKYITEFIGTFFLVLTIGLTAAAGTPLAPLAIGGVLMVMVYMGGHISGGQYNPAVTLAIFMRGKMETGEIAPYISAQLLGAMGAALAAFFITGTPAAILPGQSVNLIAALFNEILFTFALALVVLNVATSKGTVGNQYYGLAIGFTIVAAAFAGGGISGGAYNPAVGVGLTVISALLGGGTWSALWLYIVGPLIGGALAALVFRLQNPEE